MLIKNLSLLLILFNLCYCYNKKIKIPKSENYLHVRQYFEKRDDWIVDNDIDNEINDCDILWRMRKLDLD